MRRIRLTVSYDGTNYCGSQLQPNGISVEEKLNEAVRSLTKEDRRVIFASRTDSGVHALGNVAVFDTELKMGADRFTYALNRWLPEDIRVRASDEVPLTWHPRKQNCVKTYEYRILSDRVPDPLMRLYTHYCYYDIDTERMDRAAKCLVGEHDFKSFCSSNSWTENTVRTIYETSVRREGRVITIRISGSGFLYNMVRIVAGTLLEIGTGIRPESDMERILLAKDRSQGGPVAPARGLTLVSIRFETELKPEVTAENEDYAYVLDQRDMEAEKTAFLLIRRAADGSFEALVTRELHRCWRNGASLVFIKDGERGNERLCPGQAYGFYTIGEPAATERELCGKRYTGWFRVDMEPRKDL